MKIRHERCGNYYTVFLGRLEIGKQELWKEIEKILGEDAQVAHASVNNNNE